MKTAVLKVQSKGQVMLPKDWRGDVSIYQAVKDGEVIILKPVQLATEAEVFASASRVMKENKELLTRLAK